MADQFVAEIRIVGFNFAPTGWALANGQLMPISQNTALFSLLGTYYGGDGKSTFALPDFQGNAPMNQGQGPGLSERFLGEQSGSQFVTLIQSEMPAHNHNVMAANDPGDANIATNNALSRSSNASIYSTATSPIVQLNPQALTPTGGSFPHNNMHPYLTLNFVIALQGIYPARP